MPDHLLNGYTTPTILGRPRGDIDDMDIYAAIFLLKPARFARFSSIIPRQGRTFIRNQQHKDLS